MPERIVTDATGDRWDVIQQAGTGEAVFRHQSGEELRADVGGGIDALSTEQLLDRLDAARRGDGSSEVGHDGVDAASDADGYETGPG